jgi:hypothetical protein
MYEKYENNVSIGETIWFDFDFKSFWKWWFDCDFKSYFWQMIWFDFKSYVRRFLNTLGIT